MTRQVFAIAGIFLLAALGWMILGTSVTFRTQTQDNKLRQAVGQLWGTALLQRAPVGEISVKRPVVVEKTDDSTKRTVVETTYCVEKHPVPLVKSDIQLGLHLDQRQKGLLWYSTYRVRFDGTYVFENRYESPGALSIAFQFPAANGLYDEFSFEIDGQPAQTRREGSDRVVVRLPGAPGDRHAIRVRYVSQGLDTFTYAFGDGITEVRDFRLAATTDFDGFDFPGNTVSPTEKQTTGAGWVLTWAYTNLISGSGIGVQMPQKINPGPMAARISFFAPVSLGFFFFLMFVISVLKKVRVHPINYFFLAAAFFSFHLLLAYLVDHVSIHMAFVVCSAVSLFLVISYMRLVVGSRFAFVETALTQLTYLVGFSYAFFFEGFTGLTVTVGAIVTLFVVMQLTARVDWSAR